MIVNILSGSLRYNERSRRRYRCVKFVSGDINALDGKCCLMSDVCPRLHLYDTMYTPSVSLVFTEAHGVVYELYRVADTLAVTSTAADVQWAMSEWMNECAKYSTLGAAHVPPAGRFLSVYDPPSSSAPHRAPLSPGHVWRHWRLS